MNVRFRFALSTLCVVFLGLLAPSVARASNIVTNGDFSSGGTGWTHSGWDFGSNYAGSPCIGPTCITGGTTDGAYLYQDLITVVGDSYTLSFEYNPGPGTGTELVADFGSSPAAESSPAADLVNVANSYVTYSIPGLVAISTTTELIFLGRQDPNIDYLTNVDVEDNGPAGPSTATPEPSSLLLLSTGLAALGGFVRRKLRA
jgi:hypothetical protein